VTTLRGLAYYGLYKCTKKSHFRRKGDRCKNLMEKFLSLGCVNVPHLVELLRAEQATINLSNKTEEVRAMFDKSIVWSGRAGFLANQALANELAFAYFKEENRDLGWAKSYLYEAIELYNRWGAKAKVRQLVNEYGWLLDNKEQPTSAFLNNEPSDECKNTGILSRPQFHRLSHDSSFEGLEYTVLSL
jgi:hypothetical protein